MSKKNYSIKNILLAFLLLTGFTVVAQDSQISGQVTTDGLPLMGAQVFLKGTAIGTTTDTNGEYIIKNIQSGNYTISVKYLGFLTVTEEITIDKGQSIQKDFVLLEDALNLDGVVVTGTRYAQDRANNPVVVGIIDNKLLNATQSIAISSNTKSF
jgi:outer membrane receptor for ferrienterochelin and colicins